MVRAPKGDLETSSKVTSRPSEHAALPVSCWLSPGWCTCARCSARPRTVCSVHQTALTSTAGLFLENTRFFIFSSLKYWRFCWNKRVRNRDASEGQMVRMLQKWEEGDQRGEAHLNLSNNRLLATNATAIGCTTVEKKQSCDRRLPKSSRTFKPSGICCFFTQCIRLEALEMSLHFGKERGVYFWRARWAKEKEEEKAFLTN